MSDLKLLLPKYQHLDPSKHSFNEQFGLIKKRTAFQNFLHRLICILTFGIRSGNPALDRATQKLIDCAEDVLRKSKGNSETMRTLDRILHLHITVVRHNAGTGKTKLWELLSVIEHLSSPVLTQKVAKSPVARPVTQVQVAQPVTQVEQPSQEHRLMQFFEECRRGETGDLAKLPKASEVSAVWPGTLVLLQSPAWSYYTIENILLRVTRSLMLQPETERRRYLPVIAKLVVQAMPSPGISNFENTDWWDLFAAGDCDFQARTIKAVVEQHLHDSNRSAPYISRISSASQQAWQKVGEISWFFDFDNDRLRSVILGQRPESLIACLNGLASNTIITYKESLFTQFLGHMIQPHRDAIPTINGWPLEQLSDQAWELFNSNNLIPSSYRLRKWENKDYLWHHLSRHLNHPQTDRQKRLFVCFSQQFLKKDPTLLWNASVRSYFEALTPADISLMPLEKHLPAHRFLLAVRSQSLQRYGSLLKTTARNLTAYEMTDLLGLFQRYPLTIQDKVALVNLIKEPAQPTAAQPAIVQHWMQEISAHMDPLLQRFTGMVNGEQWEAAWAFVHGMDEMTRNYFLGPLRLQTLPAASEVKDLSRPLFVMALFDRKACSNMQQMLQDGMAEDSFTLWINEMVDLSQRGNLPENVFRNTIRDFVRGVKRSAHVGSLKCPLRDQYKNPSLADLTVKVLQEDIPAHRALLRLDPFFNQYIIPQSNEVTIPPEKVQEAHLRLKWLYNYLTMREIVLPATQRLLREVKNSKPSFAQIFNRQETGSDIIVKGADELEGIHAHRFLLASAFPFFKALFENNMRDSAAPAVTLQEMSLDQVKAALEYLYTGERPEFADQQSEEAFKDVWNFLKSKPPINR